MSANRRSLALKDMKTEPVARRVEVKLSTVELKRWLEVSLGPRN